MIVDLTEFPQVERALELDTTKLYLLTIPQSTPKELSVSLAEYLKSVGVNAIVLALGDIKLYEVERRDTPATSDDAPIQHYSV